MTAMRVERDSMGDIDVPQARLWGAQTQRSLEHFRISVEKMPQALIDALAVVKSGCAGESRSWLIKRGESRSDHAGYAGSY